MTGNLLTIYCVAFCIKIYKIMAIMNVETDIIASIASESDRTSRDTGDNVC